MSPEAPLCPLLVKLLRIQRNHFFNSKKGGIHRLALTLSHETVKIVSHHWGPELRDPFAALDFSGVLQFLSCVKHSYCSAQPGATKAGVQGCIQSKALGLSCCGSAACHGRLMGGGASPCWPASAIWSCRQLQHCFTTVFFRRLLHVCVS